MKLGQLLLDLVQRVLAELVQHQPRRAVARHLAAQLGADRSAGPCDEHGLARDQLGDAGLVELHRLAPEQVFGLDVAHAADLATFEQFLRRGHRQHRQPGLGSQFDGAPALTGAGTGHREHEVGDALQLDMRFHRRERAEDRHAADARALFHRVVVEQADDHPAFVLDAGQQQPRRVAGAEHERATLLDGVARDAAAHVLVQHAVGNAHRAQAHQRDDGVQRQHRARHLRQLRHQHRHGGEQPGGQAGQRQPLDLAEAGEAPHAARHAGTDEHRQVERNDAEQDPGVVVRPGAQPALEAEPEQVGDVPAGSDHDAIDRERQQLPSRAQQREEAVETLPEHRWHGVYRAPISRRSVRHRILRSCASDGASA